MCEWSNIDSEDESAFFMNQERKCIEVSRNVNLRHNDTVLD